MTSPLNYDTQCHPSDLFLGYFYKHFPQLKNKLSSHQLANIYSFAKVISHEVEDEKIWQKLEGQISLLYGLKLMVETFLPQVRRSKKPELLLIFSMVGLLASLGLAMYFEESLTHVVMNMVSFSIGVFGTCLKESFGRYFSVLIENKETNSNNY